MRLVLKGLLLLLCSVTFAGMAPAVEPTPRAMSDQTDFEFGPVVEGTPIEHSFVVHNSGDAPLILGTIKSS